MNLKSLDGLGPPKPWNSGAGGGVGYESKGGVWLIHVDYAYGIDAVRRGHRGAHSVALLTQLDLEAWWRKARPKNRIVAAPEKPEGIRWLPALFKP